MREEVLNFYLKEDENKFSYTVDEILNEIQKQRHTYIKINNRDPIYISLENQDMHDFLVARCSEYLIMYNELTLPTSIFGMKIKVGE